MTKKKPFIYSQKLDGWDWTSTISYLLVSAGVWYKSERAELVEEAAALQFFYVVFTQLFLYFFCYKSLRNFKVYFFWMLVALAHLFLYFKYKGDPLYSNGHMHLEVVFRNTILLLLLFQVLRYVSLRTIGEEHVALGRYSKTDFFDERRINGMDGLLFLVYISAMFLLLFV